jgi:hypothetical protein
LRVDSRGFAFQIVGWQENNRFVLGTPRQTGMRHWPSAVDRLTQLERISGIAGNESAAAMPRNVPDRHPISHRGNL